MTLHHGDCIEVMAAMEPESVDAVVTDPPYGLEFMGKEWDAPWKVGFAEFGMKDGNRRAAPVFGSKRNPVCRTCRKHQRGADKCVCVTPDFDETPAMFAQRYGEWSRGWAEAVYRVAKPSAYLLAFGGTRTVHRMTVALEDAGWIIRDMLVWGYASGFPKGRANLKPAWEPIVLARKPGPLRKLNIEECRIGVDGGTTRRDGSNAGKERNVLHGGNFGVDSIPAGRWPANIVLTDPIFDGGWEGVVGGGESTSGGNINGRPVTGYSKGWADERWFDGYSDSGTYSRYFLIPKASRADREPLGAPASGELLVSTRVADTTRREESGSTPAPDAVPAIRRLNQHPTVKPTDLMRHLVRLVTPAGGVVLDPFLGSGTTALAAEMEGFDWIGIEREAEYVAIAEARLNGTQRGLGLGA